MYLQCASFFVINRPDLVLHTIQPNVQFKSHSVQN